MHILRQDFEAIFLTKYNNKIPSRVKKNFSLFFCSMQQKKTSVFCSSSPKRLWTTRPKFILILLVCIVFLKYITTKIDRLYIILKPKLLFNCIVQVRYVFYKINLCVLQRVRHAIVIDVQLSRNQFRLNQESAELDQNQPQNKQLQRNSHRIVCFASRETRKTSDKAKSQEHLH